MRHQNINHSRSLFGFIFGNDPPNLSVLSAEYKLCCCMILKRTQELISLILILIILENHITLTFLSDRLYQKDLFCLCCCSYHLFITDSKKVFKKMNVTFQVYQAKRSKSSFPFHFVCPFNK